MKTTGYTLILTALGLLLAGFGLHAQEKNHFVQEIPAASANDIRGKYKLNENWYYLEKNTQDVALLRYFEESWKTVDLPHTWNLNDALDIVPGYRRDASWYRKYLTLESLDPGKRYLLYFEAVSQKAEVYVNGKKMGTHKGGYLGFEVDITKALKAHQTNRIEVRASNAVDPALIPSQKSDFFIYGGITRDVWLKTVPGNYISTMHVNTPEVSREKAETEIKCRLKMHEDRGGDNFALSATIRDTNGNIVSQSKTVDYKPGTREYTLTFPDIRNPSLWSPEDPYLYEASLELHKGGQVYDHKTVPVGYRFFRFEENGPFYLNGKRLLLKGTHRHEDYAGYGPAMPNRLHRKDMKMIKDLGANFVRLAHYPQDPEVYRMADSLGLLLWDELPWCRGGMGGKEWKTNTLNMFREQISQNRNHPSIIIWSLGNEMDWLPDYSNTGNKDTLKAFLTRLNDLAHELDPSRKTAIRKFYYGSEVVDVFSPSIWSGWYSGVYKTYENALKDAREKYPRFMHMEYGGASHMGRHTETPITGEGTIKPNSWTEQQSQVEVQSISNDGDWTENYIVDLFDWHLHVTSQLDWFTGNAQWAFKDFGTPLRPLNPIPYVNQKGLTDRAGNPKDAYYVFKSYWSDKPKFAYIESHTWKNRAGKEGVAREVSVYSNCEAVELVHNGKPLGKKERQPGAFPAHGLVWDATFEKGSNTLIARGFQNNRRVTSDTVTFNYRYAQSRRPFEILLDKKKLKNGHWLIEATVVDWDGRQCLDYNERLTFTLDGAGSLLKGYGVPGRSRVIETANGKATIELVPEKGGKATISAISQDFKGTYMKLEFE